MKTSALLSSLLGFALVLAIGNSVAAPEYLSFHTEDEQNNIEIFRKASPSVVFVTSTALYRTNPFSMNVQEIPQGSGTGFVWDESGLIVTNFHVVQNAVERRGRRILITLQDQSTWQAEVVGVAPGKDLALLRIDAPTEQLQALPLGNSAQLEVGRKVIAIGNPFGLDTTMTTGIVSALGREISSLSNRTIRDVIQTDASINPGNSGGPLLNSLGQLVGVNTQILSPSGASAGIGFAIPVNTVKKVIPQLLEYGREVQPTLEGVQLISESYARRLGIEGIIIGAVNPQTAAGRAGLRGLQQTRRGGFELGDVIIEIDGQRVRNNDDLLNALEQHQPGDTVTIVTQRGNEQLEFEVLLAPPDAV